MRARSRRRGEYSFDKKRGKLDIFLHSFAYPYGNFGGEFVELNLKGDTIDSMADPVTHKPIFSIELEPELISGIFQGEWEQRRLVRLGQIPPTMINAILAAEDHRFYEHHGVDIVRTIKAGVHRFHFRARTPGRIDADAAVDEEFFPDARAQLQAQAQGSDDGVHRGARLLEG